MVLFTLVVAVLRSTITLDPAPLLSHHNPCLMLVLVLLGMVSWELTLPNIHFCLPLPHQCCDLSLGRKS